jgi:hypothetical protein
VTGRFLHAIASASRIRRVLIIAGVVVAAGALSGTLIAYFSGGASAGSAGGAAATSVNPGTAPTSAANSGRSVTLTWSAVTLGNGQPVDGYLVTRYEADPPNLPQLTTLADCSGTIAGLTCTEYGVPLGSWQYTITPVVGDHWRGPESPKSGVITIGAASLALDQTTLGLAAFGGGFDDASVTGSLSGFASNEGIGFKLDDPSTGDTLNGTPSSADTGGDASISLALPRPSDGPHTVYAVGDSTYPSQASAAILVDTAPPTVTMSLLPAANGAGWNTSSPIEVTLAGDDEAGSGVDQITYTTDGTDPTTSGTAIVYSGPFELSSTTTVKFFATDAAGNASAVETQVVRIDTVTPANHLSLNVSAGNAILSGTTVWYRGAAAGSFTIANALTEDVGGSGPASTGYSALSGDSSGWSFTSSSVTSGPPYTSNAVSWSAATTSSPSETATGYDVAGNFTADVLTFTNDSSAPADGAVDAAGLVGTGSRYSNSTTLSIDFQPGSDAGIGLAASGFKLERASATLTSDGTSDGSCGSYGAYTQVGSDDPSSPVVDSISDNRCYRYEYLVPDRLGNTAAYTSPDIKVQTTAPGSLTPTATLSNASGDTFISGSTVFTNPQSGRSGSFKVSAAPTDATSGVLKVHFPSLAGYSSGGGDDSADPYETTYDWSGAGAGVSGSQTITATDNASLTATANFTVTTDTTPPTNDLSATKADSSAYTAGTWTNQTVTVHFTCSDAGSGVASCPADQTFGGDGVTASVSGTASDNVGNETPASFGPVKVDKTDPTITASAKNGDNSTYTAGTWTNQTVTVHYTCSDPTVGGASSGIASCPADQVFSAEGVTASTSGTATDNAGNSAGASFGPIRIDETDPAVTLTKVNGSTRTFPYLTNASITSVGGACGTVSGGSASDDSSTVEWSIGPRNGSAACSSGSWTSGSFTAISSDGTYTASATQSDGAGNTGSSGNKMVTLDATPPTVTLTKVNGVTRTFPYSTNGTITSIGGACGTSAGDTATVDWSIGTQSGTTACSSGSWNASITTISADGDYTASATQSDDAGNNGSSGNKTITVDTASPVVTLTKVNGATVTFPYAANANLTSIGGACGTVSGDVASVDWSISTQSGTATCTAGAWSATLTSISTEGTYTASASQQDAAGNNGSSGNKSITLDTTQPTNSLSLASQTGGSYLTGTTLYYHGSAAGSFRIQNAVADSGSGPDSSQFGGLGGTSTGWTFTGSTVSTPAGGPYLSNLFSWADGTTSSPTETVTGSDLAGNTRATVLTLTDDSTTPTGGALTVNGTAATGGGTTSTTTSTSFAVNSRTDYTDTGSGLVSSTLTVQSATLTAGTCGAPGSGGPFTSSTTVTGTTQPAGIVAGFCYVYTLTGTDHVGNAAGVNTTVKLNTAPTVTSTGPSSLAQGATSQNVTVNGTNFVSGAAAAFSGSGITVNSTSFVSSTQLTANITISAIAAIGAGNVTVTNPDGGAGSCTGCFTVNATPPTVTAVQLNNGSGTAGKVDAGDTIVVTFSKQMKVSSFCSAWSTDTSNQSLTVDNDVTVTLADGGVLGNDSISVSSGTCTFHLGSIDLGSGLYVAVASATFSGTGPSKSTISWNAAAKTLTIALGAKGILGTVTTVASSVATYTPNGSIQDSSGTAISGTFATGNVQQF